MGVLFSFGRSERPINPNSNNNTNTPSTISNTHQTGVSSSNNNNNNNNNNIPNSRLNLIYNQITSTTVKNRKKKNRTDLFNVSFSAYFFIAGRRFKNFVTQAAQTFLFGDQLDLSFILAHKPVTFPYDVPSLDSPSNYLQSLVNIRKDTVRLIKCCSDPGRPDEPIKYNVEFKFDCDCDIQIRIHYFAAEKFTANQADSATSHQLVYSCGCGKSSECCCLLNNANNEPIVYRKGANILFQQPNHFIIPDKYHFSNWQFNINSNYYPVVIECRPLNEQLAMQHAHITLAYIDKTIHSSHIKNIPNADPSNLSTSVSGTANNNSGYSLQSHLNNSHSYQIKPIKQKQFIDGVLYSLQEVYGIEKKSSNEEESLTEQQMCPSQTSSSLSNSLIGTTATSSTLTASSKKISQDEVSVDSTLFKEDGELDEKKRKQQAELEQELKGIECVICMCETRDTLILPCRHLCLCKLCAINLRIQSNNCPICRIPFVALLQLKLLRKKEKDQKQKQINKRFDMNQLPVLKIENLNIIFSENGMTIDENVHKTDQINENNIIEITNHVKSENDNDNFIKKEILVANENRMPRLADFYEVVSIYEAFNESYMHGFKSNNERKSSKRAKKSNNKIPKQISLPVEAVSVNEQPEVVVQIPVLPKIINQMNLNADNVNIKRIDNRLAFQARSSSVLLGTNSEPRCIQSIRSASYVDNYIGGNDSSHRTQRQESIQMGDI